MTMPFRELPDEDAAIALAEVDPEAGELDWWGWRHMIHALGDRGYRLVIKLEEDRCQTCGRLTDRHADWCDEPDKNETM